MSQRCCSPAAKMNKPISKGNRVWKRVNQLAHRLASKGVPASIICSVEHIPILNTQVLQKIRFEQGVSLREMAALAKLQSIQVLQLNISREEKIDKLRRKETQMTDASYNRQPSSQIKENLVQIETNNSARPQQAEAVFT